MHDDITAQPEATHGAIPTPADIGRMVEDRQAQQDDNHPITNSGREAPAENTDMLKARIESLESELAATKHHMLRNNVAMNFGISDDDRDVLMSGTDEQTLVAQARALAERATSSIARR